MNEDAEPVRRRLGDAVIELAREDLELFSAADLEARIEALESEVRRVRAQLARKDAGRAAADRLFGKPS